MEPCHLISSLWLWLDRISYLCMKVKILSLDVKLLMSLSTFLFLLQKTLPYGTLHSTLHTKYNFISCASLNQLSMVNSPFCQQNMFLWNFSERKVFVPCKKMIINSLKCIFGSNRRWRYKNYTWCAILAFLPLNSCQQTRFDQIILLLSIVQMFTPTSSMRVAKLYKDNTEQITNIHYR